MSYSFSVKGADKQSALKAVEDAMATIVSGQPVHARDQEQVCCAAAEMVELLADDDTKDIGVNISGSLGWDYPATGPEAGKEKIVSASVSVYACLTPREAK